MAVKTGQFAKVMLDVQGTAVELLKLREWSISTSAERIDSSAAKQKFTTHEIGLLSWEAEATCVDADTFWFTYLDKKITIDFFDKESDLKPTFRGTASMDVERTTPYDDLIETSISFTGDGDLILGSTILP